MRENEIDREVLATLTEADLLQTLGITVLGQRCAAEARTQARASAFTDAPSRVYTRMRSRRRRLAADVVARGGRRKVMQRIRELLGAPASAVSAVPPAYGAATPLQPAHADGPIINTPTPFSADAACLSFALTPQDSAFAPQPPGVRPPADAVPVDNAVRALPVGLPVDVPLPALPAGGAGAAPGEEILPAIVDEAEAARREAAEAEAARLRTVSTELTQEVREKMRAEDFCVNEAQWSTKKLLETLRRSYGWALPGVIDAMTDELQKIANRMTMPGSSVVTVGDTGAGKSTLLNALLGETSVLPTNGMRACTASIIELSYNKDENGDPYVGEVEFVSREEWEQEFDNLIDDLLMQDGSVQLSEPDQRAPSYSSWCKIYAIFGDDFTQSKIDSGQRLPGGQKKYVNPSVEQLKRKLALYTRVTRVCGTTQTVTATVAQDFKRKLERYMDSENDVSQGQFWPLVKRVRMMSRNWSLLRTGGKLVDAPGVRDDNNARDKVVKDYLRNADGIWIVASINRAVNDKTAKKMLGEAFRRELLMDGQYGEICFIATQSDVLQRSDIKRSLGLDAQTSAKECAAQRNAFTKNAIVKDYYAGLEEMAQHAKDKGSGAELRERYKLPVFCVSAVDYQKLSGARLYDGAPNVWDDAEDTEIPSLQRFLHENVLRKRFDRAHATMTALVNFCDNLESFLAPMHGQSQNSQEKAALRAKARACYDALEARLDADLRKHCQALTSKMQMHFKGTIGPQLEEGAHKASHECMATARKWSAAPSAGGMFWGTYKATTRRHGVFRIDMNQELAEHIFRTVSTVWERIFSVTVQQDLQDTQLKLREAFQTARACFKEELRAAKLPGSETLLARADLLEGPQSRSIESKLTDAAAAAKRAMTDRQRELSRTVVPLIQTTMVPGYDAGTAERGTGSHRRRIDVIETHLDRSKNTMFTKSVGVTVQGLPAMQSAVVEQLQQAAQGGKSAQRVAFSSLWDEAASSPQMLGTALCVNIA